MTNQKFALEIVKKSGLNKSLLEKYGRDWVVGIKEQLDKLDKEGWDKIDLCFDPKNLLLFIREAEGE
jgi:hypothetical protein